jgi:predicted RNA-binding Zn-ribbon protein involved in translation (DUF1610 family)
MAKRAGTAKSKMTETPTASVFACPNCGGTIALRAAGQSLSAVCNQCFSIIDVNDKTFTTVAQDHQYSRKTLIELGSRGRFSDINWEVIGYMLKTDGTGNYSWEEYLLFNPYNGFRFLVQAAGHWTYYQVLDQQIGSRYNALVHEGETYKAFVKGESIVKYVKGEFYWRVRQGERARVADYIAPPKIISFERNNEETRISRGVYVSVQDVVTAFRIKDGLPSPRGVAPNQPVPFGGQLSKIWAIAVCAVAAAFAVQIFSAARSDRALVQQFQFGATSQVAALTQSSPSFNIPKDGNVLIESSASVNNNWVELGMSLVNEQTNEEYNLTQAIEYYFGSTSDGSWTEGSQTTYTYISSVPAGSYKLLVDAVEGTDQGLPVSVTIKRDVPSFMNFIWMLILLLLFPLGLSIRRWLFESGRWRESDFPSALYNPILKGQEDQ